MSHDTFFWYRETYAKLQRNVTVSKCKLSDGEQEAHISALLCAAAKGSQKDFKMLVLVSSPKIFGILVTILRDRDQATDALQFTFARVWQKAASFDPERGSAEVWMGQIARNHAIDLLRRQKRRAEVQPEDNEEFIDSAPTPEMRLERRSEMRKMLSCLETLEPKKAEAVRLCYLQGLSYADLAERMGVPLNTVRTWLRRGLAALRECIDGP